uniref:Capsid protein VP1 n=1 Tax=Murine norovirus TaxID=357231 RepID=I3PL90_NORV|nr:capsid protein VP1 [Murine norovirus]
MRMSDGATPKPNGSEAAGQDLVPSSVEQAIPIQPVAGAAVAAPTAGQINQIDPWIFQNFVQCPLGEFSISPRNTPGEILFDLALGPGLNPYLAHLSAMYTGWVGNMEVQLVLAGNAFTAGKVVVALVPPYFPQGSLTTAQITCFPHVMCDVRTLEPIQLPLLDVRRVLWHATQNQEEAMRLVCMLYTPLRTNSPGDESFVVSGRLLSRPSPDFNFVYLTPPIERTIYRMVDLPVVQPRLCTHSRWPAPVYQILVDPSLPSNPQWQNGRVLIDGTLLGTTPISSSWVASFAGTAEYSFQSPPSAEIGEVSLFEIDGSAYTPGDRAAPLGYPDFSGTLEVEIQTETTKAGQKLDVHTFNLELKSQTVDQAPFQGKVYMDLEASASLDLVNGRVRASPRSVAAFKDELPSYNSGLLVPLAPPLGPFLPGEVLLRFRTFARQVDTTDASAQAVDCALPQELVSWFASSNFTVQSEALLLRYRNTLTGQLLFECKLYSEGYIALSYTGSSPLTFPTDGFLEVVSWVPRLHQLASVGSLATGRSLKQ